MAGSNDSVTVSERLLAEVRKSGLSHREIGRRSGVSHVAISHFVRGTRGLSMPAIDALAEVLGLQLKKTRRKG